MKFITKYRQYCVSLIQLFLFIPFYRQGFIGSDWDSYGSYASSYLIYTENIYLPSRSPGFPLFEYLISSLISFQVRGALLVIFIFLVGVNLITHKLFDDKNENDFLYYALLLSPILLISSFSIIDYVVGLFFSLAAIYVVQNLDKPEVPFLVLMLLSSATRLSNIIFFIAGIYILNKKDFGTKKLLLITLFYLFGLMFIYYSAFNLAGGLCFLNLTNTDHFLFQRIGRFIYKQTYLVGLPALFGLIYILIKNRTKFEIKESNLPYILIFILFEISFIRLPTEEGHMLPALFMFFLLLSQIKISNQVQIYLLFSILISNFIYIDLIKVDVPNHAKNFEFSPSISAGLLMGDYKERALKGSNANYHIDNAINQVIDSWSNGGPNC